MKLIKKLFTGLYREDQGAVIILVALLMVVLLGMAVLAVDVGSLYQVRRQTVNAADSAALAGAQELILLHSEGETSDSVFASEVESVVKEFTEMHGAVFVEFDSDYPIQASSEIVKVTVEKEAELYFAPAFYALLGSLTPDSMVTATAAAQIESLSAVGNLVPFAIVAGEYSGITQLWFGAHEEGDIGSGNCHAVQFGNSQSTIQFKEYIESGYPDLISKGHECKTETGGMKSHVEDALNYRVELHNQLKNNPDYDIYKGPLVIHIPIIEFLDDKQGGKRDIKVVDFAAFKLDETNPYDFSGTQGNSIKDGKVFGVHVPISMTSGITGGPAGDGPLTVSLIE